MAIASVNQMVKDRLPYLNNTTFDLFIERKRIEVAWMMQGQSGKTDGTVESEAGYTSIQNILFASMIAYYLLSSKAIETMAGNGTTGGGTRLLKRAKADVTEAEFMLTRAEDGSLIQMKTTDLLKLLLDQVCAISKQIGWVNPLCKFIYDLIPAFIVVGDDCPPNPCNNFPFFPFE